MKHIHRFIYLLYYLKESDFKQVKKSLAYAHERTGKSGSKIISDAVFSVFKYNVSIKDYFCFRFYELSPRERLEWAGTGFMYEYQLLMNPREVRGVLEDKIRFLNHFKPYLKRKYLSLNDIKADARPVEDLLANPSGRMVLKGSHGQVGAEVEIIQCSDYKAESLIEFMKKRKYDLAEEYVIQHPDLMALSPTGLNTVRVFTQLHQGKVDLLGARLRISVNSPVDNMAAGNLAAPVDLKTGIVNGPGVYSDITKKDMTVHPVTGKAITGFAVPHWKEVTALAETAAKLIPENRSVGWDIAVTEKGPELIEGNHNWCKLLWQLPVKKGLKKELEKYL